MNTRIQGKLEYTDVKTITLHGEQIKVKAKITLDDKCSNGHEDFSVTADLYEKKKNGRWFEYGGGCCHDEILKAFPSWQIFVDLHLCDYKGTPIYAQSNGNYFIKELKDNPSYRDTLNTTYMMTDEEIDILSKCGESNILFTMTIEKLGIKKRWENRANRAIKELKKMTGKSFNSTAEKEHWQPLTSDQMKDYKDKEKSGYYLPETIKQRALDKLAADKLKKIKDCEDNLKLAQTKLERDHFIDIWAINQGITKSDNIIVYTHTETVVMNWQDSDYYHKWCKADEEKLENEIMGNSLFENYKVEIKQA